jgi:hypothetical protein
LDKHDTFKKIANILINNRDKSFVKRIVERDKYPVIENKDGTVSTHKMSTMEMDGVTYAYPTILFDGKELKEYDPDTAFDYAVKTGNVIPFDDPKEADWFTKNYKSIWMED